MENTTRTQRTPAEIIAETEARLERLRLKEAKAQAKANPTVSALMEERDEVQKDLREAKKLLGSGPQSAEARIAKHEAWIMRITQQVDEAEDALSSTEQRLSEIDKRISDEVASLMSSKELASEG
jgi:capsule polysaccharide export protein KpsE/RkpR